MIYRFGDDVEGIHGWACAESGEYPFQRGDACDVPGADVRIECRRTGAERLRAESQAVRADGQCSHITARMRVRHITRTRTHTWARMRGTHASVIRSTMRIAHRYRHVHLMMRKNTVNACVRSIAL